MKIKYRTNFLLRIWIWVSLVINGAALTSVLVYTGVFADNYVIYSIAILLSFSLYGAFYIWGTVIVKNFNIIDIVMEYFAALTLSGIAAYLMYKAIGFLGILIMILLIVFEAGVIPIIIHRYRIKNKIKAVFKKR